MNPSQDVPFPSDAMHFVSLEDRLRTADKNKRKGEQLREARAAKNLNPWPVCCSLFTHLSFAAHQINVGTPVPLPPNVRPPTPPPPAHPPPPPAPPALILLPTVLHAPPPPIAEAPLIPPEPLTVTGSAHVMVQALQTQITALQGTLTSVSFFVRMLHLIPRCRCL